MNPGVTTSYSCFILSVGPVANLLCFFVVISLIHWPICTLSVQQELPRIFVSASFASYSNVGMVPFCDLGVGNKYKCSHPIQFFCVSTARTVQESGQNGFVTLFVCFPESIVGIVIDPLPFCWSVSSSMRRILFNHIGLTRHHIDLCSIVDFFLKAASICRKYNVQCPFGIVL